MFKGIVSVLLLAAGLTGLALAFGYVEYRKNMNSCIEQGGLIVKTSHGLKCVPRGEIRLI